MRLVTMVLIGHFVLIAKVDLVIMFFSMHIMNSMTMKKI